MDGARPLYAIYLRGNKFQLRQSAKRGRAMTGFARRNIVAANGWSRDNLAGHLYLIGRA